MLSKFPRYSRHVLWRPCKDVPVLTEELDEIAFLFATEPSSDDHAISRVGGAQCNTLAILGCLERSLIIRSLGLRDRHGCLHLSLGHCHEIVELAPLCINDQGI